LDRKFHRLHCLSQWERRSPARRVKSGVDTFLSRSEERAGEWGFIKSQV
jgi:hypothetical protein